MELIGIPIDDWWEQAAALYFIGLSPAWLVIYRFCTEWQLRGEAVVRRWKNGDSAAGVFWLGVFWPIVAVISAIVVLCGALNESLDGSRLLDGKPPKNLLAEANEKKADRLLSDEPEPVIKTIPDINAYSNYDTHY